MSGSSIGIIGLGRSGYTVFGFDKSPEANKTFKKLGGILCENPAAVARETPLILIFVLNDAQVIEVISGKDGLLDATGPGSIIVCMSTINRETLELQAENCKRKKIGLVDCPFTGGPKRIPGGNLTLIAAAPDEYLKKVRKELEMIGNITLAGEQPGMGQAVKHCNQLLVGVTHAATMEVITLARRLGLDDSLVSSVVGSGIAGSDYFRLLSESILENKTSPGGLGQMCKDVAIVMNTVEQVELPAFTIRGASWYFSRAEKDGMFDREGADLIRIVDRTGLKDLDL